MRVRGLKLNNDIKDYEEYLSHPMRVRGLKHTLDVDERKFILSHPMRVRGLKHKSKTSATEDFRRTPCGCVD